MDEKKAKDRAKSEKNRLTRLLKAAGIKEEKLKLMQSVISNTAMMKAKLDDAQMELEGAALVDTYENGGGQTGTRANPVITAYSSLWKCYMTGMKTIIDSMPEAAAKSAKEIDNDKPKNMLQIVMEKRKEA